MKPTLLAGLLGLALASTTSAANFIVNGSFEDPATALNTATPIGSVPSWTGTFYLFNGNGSANGYTTFPSPSEGQQYMDIGLGLHGLTLAQQFTVPITGNYTLSWADNAHANAAPGANLYSVSLVDSLSLSAFSGNFDPGHSGPWLQRDVPLSLTAGSYTLSFHSLSNSNDILIDAVSVVAVPEPVGYVAVAGITLVAFGTWRRTRA